MGAQGCCKIKAGDPRAWHRVCSGYTAGTETCQTGLDAQRRVFKSRQEKDTSKTMQTRHTNDSTRKMVFCLHWFFFLLFHSMLWKCRCQFSFICDSSENPFSTFRASREPYDKHSAALPWIEGNLSFIRTSFRFPLSAVDIQHEQWVNHQGWKHRALGATCYPSVIQALQAFFEKKKSLDPQRYLL